MKHFQAKSHRIGSVVMDNVLICPVVDRLELEHWPSSFTGQELSEDDKYKWDYCSPAQIETIISEDYEDEEMDYMDAVPLPGVKSGKQKPDL